MTRPYAEVIGDPISHSKSPLIHNFWLNKLGIDAEYRACHVRPDELVDYFARRRRDAAWRGCNVTLPHKVAAQAFVDSVEGYARRIGAINIVNRSLDGSLEGLNSDAAGFLEGLSKAEFLPQSQNHITTLFTILGAGGAARAVGAALEGADITFVNRTLTKAQQLADEFSAGAAYGYAQTLADFLSYCNSEPEWAGADKDDGRFPIVIVNTTSAGMVGQPELPISLSNFPKDTIVYDIVYSPLETPLLREAKRCGLRTIDGLWMLIGQARIAFKEFFGDLPSKEYDAELRALLIA